MTTATNPETGEKVVFDGHRWVPLPQDGSVNPVLGTIKEAANSALFGYGPEVEGAAGVTGQGVRNLMEGKPFYEGPGFAERAASIRGQQERFGEEYPVTSTAASLAGGVAGPGGVAGKTMGLAKEAGLLGRTAAGIGVGTAEGALAGSGYAGPDRRLGGAKSGGAWGAGVGALVPLLGAGSNALMGTKLYNTISGRFGDVTDPARKAVLKALSETGLTLEQAMGRIKRLGENATLADVVPGLAEAVANTGNRAGRIAERVLNNRGLRQAHRVSMAVDEKLTKIGFLSEKTRLAADKAKNARMAYGDAYAAKPTLDSPEIAALLKNPAVKKGIKSARVNPANADLPDNSIELLDAAYKEIGAASRKAGGSHAMNQLRVSLRAAMVKENPKYGVALKKFSDDSSLEEALAMGEKALRPGTRPAEIRATMKSLGEAERDAYRVGAADALQTKIFAAKDTADVIKRIFGSPTSRAQIRAVFPSDRAGRRAFREFEVEMRREAVLARTEQRVLGNSRTQIRESEAYKIGGMDGGVSGAVASGRPQIAVGRAVGRVGSYFQKPSEGLAGEIASQVFAPGVKPNLQQLQELQKLVEQMTRSREGRRAAANMLLGASAGQSGR